MQQQQAPQGEKKPYVKPELKVHGSVAELTQHPKPQHDVHGKDRGGPGSHLWF